LTWLEDQSGRLKPDDVVADAKLASSPLHALFDWNIDAAARSWWVECAREIIRAVKINITTIQGEVRAPIYVHDASAEGQCYRSIFSLKADPAAARQSLIEELTRAAGVITRARGIAAAFGLEDEIDAMLTRLIGLRTRVEQPAEHASAS
jgi:hypothetical protein